jgi:hypothetical protein
MKVTTIEWKEQTNGDYAVLCPLCGNRWKNATEPDYKLCACVRFMWTDSSIAANGELMFYGDWDTKSFEKAYRAAHWEKYRDDDIITAELDSLERSVLSAVECPQIDEIAELQECGPGHVPIWITTFLGLKNRRPSKRQQRIKQITSSAEQAPLVPEWAVPFISQKFDTRVARAAGWWDQGSARAHFGVAHGNSVWLYKIDDTSDRDCHCPHVWWGFLFVKLAKGNRIAAIRTEVLEVFPDGRGELLCTDFVGPDVLVGRAALAAATGSVEVKVDGNNAIRKHNQRKVRNYENRA